jgi:hypothetical protein
MCCFVVVCLEASLNIAKGDSAPPRKGGCSVTGTSANDPFTAIFGVAVCAIALGAARRRRGA